MCGSNDRKADPLAGPDAASQKLLMATLESLPGPIALLEGSDFRIRVTNQPFIQLLDPRHRPGDLAGRPVLELLSSQYQAELHDALDTVLTNGESVHAECKYYDQIRGDIYIAWTARLLPTLSERGNKMILLAGLDETDSITFRMQLAETAIEAQRDRRLMDLVWENSPIGLAFLDSDLRFVRINATLAQLGGQSVQAHIGHRLSQLLPELAPLLEPILREVLQSGRPRLNLDISGETPAQPGIIRYWLCNYFPVISETGQTMGVAAVVTDHTSRKIGEEQRERSLEEARQQRQLAQELLAQVQQTNDMLQALIKASPLPIVALDLDAQVILWNPSAETTFGWRQEEVLHRPIPTIPGESMAEARSMWKEIYQGTRYVQRHMRRLRKDGTTIEVDIWAAALRDAGGTIRGILGMFKPL